MFKKKVSNSHNKSNQSLARLNWKKKKHKYQK